MITKADHKPIRYLDVRMNTMQVTPVQEPKLSPSEDSNAIDNPNSDLESDCFRFGNKHYIHKINGEVDNEYNVGIWVKNSHDLHVSMQQIENEILAGRITITINEIHEDWDDIPSPTQEDLDRAIAICDRYKLPDPIVPKTQETGQPSWD